ncbi:MAG: DMT family transporter [Microgenomates group bacterium]|nr:DMT family transporter [Microgenomates group bacterium]
MSPFLALIIANTIWGAASPIFKYALINIPPFTLAFLRFSLASFIILPFMGKNWQAINSKDFFKICLAAFFGITVNIAFFFLGLKKTTSINAPVIASAGPVFLYFLSIVFLKEKPKIKVFFGLLISLLGVLIIILSPILLDQRRLIINEVEGNLFFVLATLGSVLNTLINKEVLKKNNPFMVTLIAFIFGALTFVPFMIPELKNWSFSDLNYQGYLGIIFGAFFSSALAYYLLNYGLTKIKAQEVGLFTYIDPVVAVIIAAPLLKEYPNFYYFIGAFLVFLGIYLAEKRIHWHPFDKIS